MEKEINFKEHYKSKTERFIAFKTHVYDYLKYTIAKSFTTEEKAQHEAIELNRTEKSIIWAKG